MGITRRARLTGADAFSRALRARARLAGRWLTLSIVENNLGFSRLGVVIGRRELPLAVRRNRLKRIARDCFRNLPAADGWDVVVRLKTRLGQDQLPAAEAELRSLFARLVADGKIVAHRTVI